MVLQHPRWAKKGLQEGRKRVIHCKSAEGKVFGMKPTSLASSSSEEEKVGEGEEKRRRRRKKRLPLKAALAAPGVRGLGGLGAALERLTGS